jgi:tetratricopeptide (TPR) repeat protein
MFNEDKDRRVVPRWRDSLTTVATGELAPLTSRRGQVSRLQFLDSKLEDWREHRTVSFAADLVGAAVVLNRESEVKDAAEFLLSNSSDTSIAALRLAKRILQVPHEETTIVSVGNVEAPTLDAERKAIRSLRMRLRDDPRNAIGWIDIARHYSIIGHNEQAKRSIQNGIALAPENRFVLRSAARFFVHIGDHGLAHNILQRSDRTKSDPWLLAAEIATATVAGKTSKLTRRGRNLLNTCLPFQITELASAMATLDLNAGNNRSARKLFQQSLIEPTDNSIAQVEWASEKISNLTLEQRHLNAPLSYEARALDFYLEGKWPETYRECLSWFNDEPYSSRPAVLGTFIASVAQEKYSEAIRLARRSLNANPYNQLLRNNLTFALASAGKLDDAEKEYLQMDPDVCDEAERISWFATGGLLLFRRKRITEGRTLYQKALDLAKKDLFRTAVAATFLAREESLAGTPRALAAYAEAVDAVKVVSLKSLAAVLSTVLGKINRSLNDRHKK